MKKTKKVTRLFAFVLTLAIMMAFSVSAFASSTYVEAGEIEFDSSHGRMFSTTKTISTGSKVLNQYTSATRTPSGTTVTTWKSTQHATQFWEAVSGLYGGTFYVCYNNANVALNVYRSESQPQLNVYTLVGNNYADAAIYNNGSIYYAKPRGNHTQNMYINVTTENTPALDGNGTSKLCRWKTTGTSLYQIDTLPVLS